MNLAGPAALASLLIRPAALASQLRPDPPWWFKRWPLPLHLPPEPLGFFNHPPLPSHLHTLVAGGMPGWQITLIAAGAVPLAAALAVAIYRRQALRRRATVSAA